MKIVIDIKLILMFQIIYQLQNVNSDIDDSLPEPEYSDELDVSASEPEHTHRHRHLRHRHKKTRDRNHNHDRNRHREHDHDHDRDLDHDHNHDHDHEHDHDHDHENSHEPLRGGRDASDEYDDDCDCTCNKCDNPPDCCKSVCKSCGNYRYPGSGMGQSSVVFVPYPYPIMPIIPPPSNVRNAGNSQHGTMRSQAIDTTLDIATTTTATTTTTTITTTTEAPNLYENLKSESEKKLYLKSQSDNEMLESVLKSVVDDYSNIIVKTPDKLKNGNSKYMLTSLRRTRPTWMPKFGIVPISDNIARQLISQIRRGPFRRQNR